MKKVVIGHPEKKVSEQTWGVRRCKDLRPTFMNIKIFHTETLKLSAGLARVCPILFLIIIGY